jgi:hypothetical protein
MDDETLFSRVARCIYGAGFVAGVSEDLTINFRTVQRWAGGTRYPPRDVWERLAVLLDQHINHTAGLLIELGDRLEAQGEEWIGSEDEARRRGRGGEKLS